MRHSATLFGLACVVAALAAAVPVGASLAGGERGATPPKATARGWAAQTNGLSHSATLNGVAIASTGTLWTVGTLADSADVDHGVIYRSTDGGAYWARRFKGAAKTGLTAVGFSGSRGWAVGYRTTAAGKPQGYVLSTADGGATWKTQKSDAPVPLYAVSVVDTDNAWVVGDGGTVRCTANGGKSWTARNTGKATSLRAVTFLDRSHGWAVGDNGTILHTNHGGKSWTAQTSHTHASLSAVAFTSASSGWVAGSAGVILHTTNGGGTWKRQSSNLGTYIGLGSLAFTDGTHGWAVGSASYRLWGVVLYTSDGGKDWRTQTYRMGAGLRAVACPAHSILAWAAGDKGTVLHTNDGGGIGFVDRKAPTTKALNSIVVTRGNRFTVKYSVYDAQSVRAATWIEVETTTGANVQTYWIGLKATKKTLTTKLKATMAKGRYVYKVVAIDLAGHTVAAPGANTLTVK